MRHFYGALYSLILNHPLGWASLDGGHGLPRLSPVHVRGQRPPAADSGGHAHRDPGGGGAARARLGVQRNACGCSDFNAS